MQAIAIRKLPRLNQQSENAQITQLISHQTVTKSITSQWSAAMIIWWLMSAMKITNPVSIYSLNGLTLMLSYHVSFANFILLLVSFFMAFLRLTSSCTIHFHFSILSSRFRIIRHFTTLHYIAEYENKDGEQNLKFKLRKICVSWNFHELSSLRIE